MKKYLEKLGRVFFESIFYMVRFILEKREYSSQIYVLDHRALQQFIFIHIKCTYVQIETMTAGNIIHGTLLFSLLFFTHKHGWFFHA